MTPTTLHKVYAGAIALVVVLAVVVGVAWSSHVRDEAKRDAVIDSQKSEIDKITQRMSDDAKAAREQIAALQQQKQVVIQQPQQAPTIIREQIPFTTPVVQTAPITKETLPDAPVAQLTKQNEVDLAQFALTCKQCTVDRDHLAGELKDEKEVNDRQKKQLDAAMQDAKGGSVWQRTKRILEFAVPIGISGYALGRAHK